jgi:hypothetical protein
MTKRLTNERQLGSRRNHVAGEAVFHEMRIALPFWQFQRMG